MGGPGRVNVSRKCRRSVRTEKRYAVFVSPEYAAVGSVQTRPLIEIRLETGVFPFSVRGKKTPDSRRRFIYRARIIIITRTVDVRQENSGTEWARATGPS